MNKTAAYGRRRLSQPMRIEATATSLPADYANMFYISKILFLQLFQNTRKLLRIQKITLEP